MQSKNSCYLVGAIAASISLTSPAAAQSKSFNIPPQAASSGIQVFARQAGVQVLSTRNDIRDKRTNGVRGTMSAKRS